MDKKLVIYDDCNAMDNARVGASSFTAFNTSIDIKNLETGEIIFKGLKNKVIIPGSGLIARKLFDISTPEITPSYNTAFGAAMYTPESDTPPSEPDSIATKDDHKILLFCCGIDGCGSENSQVYPVDYTKWMAPENMIPFRYQSGGNDLTKDLRQSYFGRTAIDDGAYYAYYFKRFETDPALIQQFVDGTPVDATIYDSAKTETAESYVELTLRITKEDIRDFFIATVGIDEARINSISLCSAYPVEEDGFVYYKEIRPLTKLNIPNEQMIDTTKGIEIIYHIYM